VPVHGDCQLGTNLLILRVGFPEHATAKDAPRMSYPLETYARRAQRRFSRLTGIPKNTQNLRLL
jgi:hypothetical protein